MESTMGSHHHNITIEKVLQLRSNFFLVISAPRTTNSHMLTRSLAFRGGASKRPVDCQGKP